MEHSLKLPLKQHRLGRALLPFAFLALGGKIIWPAAGVRRELFPCRRGILTALAAAILVNLDVSANAADTNYYCEPFRPQFHFTPEKNWMNDPNGMVYYEGEYHLFYQYNSFGDKWGHMSWAHAVSPDLVHWQHLPLALPEENGVMIFSGSAVVDWNNSSGFGQDGKPPLVAIYTGHYTGRPLQNQNLAYSNDRGRTWTKYPGNPVLDIGKADFRDPKVFWHEATHRWVMVVANPLEKMVQFYGSPDLKRWQLLGHFGPAGATNGVWECPDLFPMAVNGNTNDVKWVLIVNLNPGGPAGGSGSQYFVGQFDGEKFTLDPVGNPFAGPARWLDYGRDFYAGVTWSGMPEKDGRRIVLGWMSNWDYGQNVPTSPWRSAMTIPRELGLRKTTEGIRLIEQPVREMQALRANHFRFRGGDVAAANAWLAKNKIAGNGLELIVTLAVSGSGTQELQVLKGASEKTVIGVDRDRGRVFFDRTQSGQANFNPAFPGRYDAPLAERNGTVKLHIFVDACSVEVFVNDGEVVLTDLVFPSLESRAVELAAGDANTKISSIEAWTLKSSWRQ